MITGAGQFSRAMSRTILVLAIICLVLVSSGCTMPWQDDEVEPRDAMRDLVQSIATKARRTDADFIVVPQNGLELLTRDGKPNGALAKGYVGAIDGVGREDLFFGYTGMDRPTPVGELEHMSTMLNVSTTQGKPALVTDYCSQQGYIWDSIRWNAERGFLSFAASSLELDAIPEYPVEPKNVNTDNVTSLAAAKNFLYLINPGAFEDREDYLEALRSTRFDVLIIDLFYNGTPLTSQEVTSLKVKSGGGTRLVLGYMSIGEAEDYRYYWNNAWNVGGPDWLEGENPDWEGNYKVQYWDSAWRQIIYKSEDSYLSRILDAGFDGVYLDQIEAYEHFED